MSQTDLFSSRPSYRSFIDKIENLKKRRTNPQNNPAIKTKVIEFGPGEEASTHLANIVRGFRKAINEFIDKYKNIDYNYLLYVFKRENLLQQLTMMIDCKMAEENKHLKAQLQHERDINEKLNSDLQQHTLRQSTMQRRQHQGKNNFNAYNIQGNLELTKTLYDKAKSVSLQQFHQVVNSFFLKDKVKLTNVKQWSKDESHPQSANKLIQAAIQEVRSTLSKGQPKSSVEYLDNTLKEQFVGRKDKFEIVARLMMNDDVLKHLEDVLDVGNIPCSQPCCINRNRLNKTSSQSAPKTRYMNVRRSSQVCYQSDEVSRYMDKFNKSMRQRKAKEEDIRSISKTNLEATESFEKFFNKQLNRRKKMEHREKAKIDNTLRQFAMSFK